MAFFFFQKFFFFDNWLLTLEMYFVFFLLFSTSIANMTTKDICEFLENLCFDKDAVQKIIIDFNGFQTTPLTSTKMNFNHLQDQRDIHHGSSIRAYLEYIWCLNCFDPQVSTRFTTVWGCMYHSCQNAWKPQRLQNSFTSCVNNSWSQAMALRVWMHAEAFLGSLMSLSHTETSGKTYEKYKYDLD